MISDMTSIVIPVWNKPNLTKLCIESIIENTTSNYEVIIVDNGSEGETANYLDEIENKYEQIRAFYNETNKGFVIATNQGIREAIGEYIITLNNDTEILPSVDGKDWIQILREALDSDPKIVLVGPATNNIHVESDPILENLPNVKHKDGVAEIDFIGFWCAMFKKELMDEIGYLDENIKIGYYDDIDFAMNICYHGYKISGIGIHESKFNVTHVNQASLKEFDVDELVKINGNYVVNKWTGILMGLKESVAEENKESISDKTKVKVVIRYTNKIAIIVPTWNNLQYLKTCVESIIRNSSNYNYSLIIIDNGSFDGTKEYCAQLASENDSVIHIRNEYNKGVPVAFNQGLMAAKGLDADFIVLFNDDAEVVDKPGSDFWIKELTPDQKDGSLWLSLMIEKLCVSDDIGIVGPSKVMSWDKEINFPHLLFWCVMLKSKVVDQIGQFDEVLSPVWGEDKDYCMRIEKAGYIQADAFSPVTHLGSVTVHKINIKDLKARNLEYFCKKWPEYINIDNVNPKLQEIVKKNIRDKSVQVSELKIISSANTVKMMKSAVETTEQMKQDKSNREEMVQHNGKVLIGIPTKNRPESLCLLLFSLIKQTYVEWDLLIIDDNDDRDDKDGTMYHHSLVQALLTRIMFNGHEWYIIEGEQKGPQVAHQKILDYAVDKYEYILRLDDDIVIESDFLEILFESIILDESIGGVAGTILSPTIRDEQQVAPEIFMDLSEYQPKIEHLLSSDCYLFVQKLPTTELIECEHLYSSYLFRTQAGIDAGGYPKNLSEVGHREETLFSYSMYKQGYRLLLNPNAIAWHYRNLYGGIRWTHGEFNPKSLWDHDEEIFRKEIVKLIDQTRKIREYKI